MYGCKMQGSDGPSNGSTSLPIQEVRKQGDHAKIQLFLTVLLFLTKDKAVWIGGQCGLKDKED